MPFIIGRVFAEVQSLIKVKLALSLEPLGILCILIDTDKLQPKVLPTIIFHTIWSKFCRGQN